jgi:beta-galactosidase
MVYSYEELWAADFKPRPTHRLSWLKHFELYYAALHRANIAVDLVEPTADLGRYKLVVAPMLYIVTPQIADSLRAFVAAGGTLVTTLFSGYCDECAVITEQPLPGELRELLGIRVKESDPFPEGLRNSLRPEAAPRTTKNASVPGFTRAEYGADYWADVIELEGAEAVLRFRRDYHAEAPAVTVNASGKGAAVYIGTVGDEEFLDDLVSWLVGLAGLSPPLQTPPGLQHRVRESDTAIYTFLLNHNDTSVSVELTRELFDVFRATQVRGSVLIGPHDVLLLKEFKAGGREA